MKPPSNHARAMLERYKAADSLGADAKAQLGEVIRERALRGDLPRFDVDPASPAIPGGGLAQHVWGSAAGKAGLLLLVLGTGAGVTYQLQKDSGRAELYRANPSAVQAHDTAAASSPTEPAPAPEPNAAPKQAGASPLQTSAPAKPGRPLASAVEPTVDEEVKLVKGAQGALQAGDTKRALQLLNEHAARFPTGKLASVRQVAHMTALCQAGQVGQARQEATSFLAKNPSSPFAERVKTICR